MRLRLGIPFSARRIHTATTMVWMTFIESSMIKTPNLFYRPKDATVANIELRPSSQIHAISVSFSVSEGPGGSLGDVYFLVRRLNYKMGVVVMNVCVCSASARYFFGIMSCKGRLRKNFAFKPWTSISMGVCGCLWCFMFGWGFVFWLFFVHILDEIRVMARLRMRMRMGMGMMVVGRKLEDRNLQRKKSIYSDCNWKDI